MAQQMKKKDTTARDITRKLKQIKKYVDELQVLGVKQCYVYTSTHTGGLYVYGLYVYGHQEFASVFQQHHLEATASMSGSNDVRETYILLSVLKAWVIIYLSVFSTKYNATYLSTRTCYGPQLCIITKPYFYSFHKINYIN